MSNTKSLYLAKPHELKKRRKKKNHSTRNKRRSKSGMIADLDKVARQAIVIERDADVCQRCNAVNGGWDLVRDKRVVIQWSHVKTRRYLITRWEPCNSLALCDACHKWYDNQKDSLGTDWFIKNFRARWDDIMRILSAGTRTTDLWVRELWEARCAKT